jgi:DNA-binding CsgD family transcriptional regulator
MCALDARDLAEVRQGTTKFRAFADEFDDPEWRLLAEWKDGLADAIEGNVQVGLARVGAAASEAAREGWEGTGVTAFREASTIAASALDYGAAERWISEGVRYADSVEQSHCAHVMRSTQAMVSWAGADPVEATRRARQAIVDKGCSRGTYAARWALGFVAMTRGEVGAASAELTDALAFGTTSGEIELILPPLWGLAETALQAGEASRASVLCREAFDRAAAVNERVLLVPFVVTGIRAALQDGRPLEAAAWLTACTARLEGIPDVSGAALAHGRGLVALAEGATGVARIALETAVAGWDRHGRTWEAAWARADLAQCLVRSNRYAEAVTIGTEARALAQRLESPVLDERAEAVLRMARGRVPDDEPWRPLTSREFEVARLIGEGMTNAEIAETLDIAPKTASSHVEHILAKLGASRRAEIATWASNVQARSTAPRTAPVEQPTQV